VVPVIAGPVDRLFIHHFSAKWGGVWVEVRGRHWDSSEPSARRRRPGYHHWSRKKCYAAKAGKEAGRPGFQPGSFCRNSAPRLLAHRWSANKCSTAETMQGTGSPGSQRRSPSPSLARCSAASIQAKIQVTATLNRCRAIQANIHADDSLCRCRAILVRIEHQAAWAAERKYYQLRTEQKHG
jgi:hypothetical protein